MSDFLSNFVNHDDENKEKKEVKTEEVSEKREKRSPSRSDKKMEPEHVEFDPTYKKRRQKKLLFISIAVFLAIIGIMVAYYRLNYVQVPNFQRKEIANAREWSAEEGIILNIKNTYSFEMATNKITKQSVNSGEKIKKGKTLILTVSMGPNPDEQVILPEFAAMNANQAKDWVKKEKAENVSVIEQYDEKLQKAHLSSRRQQTRS